MRTHPTFRLAPLALLAAAALLAACFDQDVPTEQIGGTEYGLLLNVPSPVRTPQAAFVGRFAAATPRRLDSLVVTLQNLEPLAGRAAYRFYAVTAAGAATPVSARLTALRTDSTIVYAPGATVGTVATSTDSSELGTSTFLKGMPGNTIVRARFPGAQFGDSTRTWFVVTIEADSTAPNYATAPKPLFARYRSGTGATPFNVLATGNAQFGNFNPAGGSFVFTPLGRGRSAFWDRFRDGRLLYSAIAENLTQPPIGYYYQPWLRDTRTRRAIRFGELRDFGGNSLRDADLAPITTAVAQLPAARFGTTEDSIGVPLNTWEGVHLVLEPKLGADSAFALTSVLVGTVGDTLGLRGTGSLRVRVTRGGNVINGVTVVATAAGTPYLVGRGNVAPTDNGAVFIQAIPAGEVDVRLVPPAGITAPTQATRVTISARDTTEVSIALP